MMELPEQKQSPADNVTLWDRARRLIRLAEDLRGQANEVIERFIGEVPDKENLEEDHVLVELRNGSDSGYQVICGTFNKTEKSNWSLYWHYARFSAAVQFGGGFGTFTKEAIHHLQEFMKLIGDSIGADFWGTPFSIASAGWKGEGISWLYQRLVLLDACVWHSEDVLAKGVGSRLCAESSDDGYSQRPLCLAKNLSEKMREDSEQPEYIRLVRLQGLLRIAQRVFQYIERLSDIDRKSRLSFCAKRKNKECMSCAEGLDESMPFRQLERALTRGNDRASAFQVALLLRLLGGRYLHGRFRPDPRWETAFREGVTYVLGKQSKDWEACWHDVRSLCEQDDPWVHVYIPLLHLLDLAPQTLVPHLDNLVEACEHSLFSLKQRLSFLLKERELLPAFQNDRNAFRAVIASLSLGMAVYDRFRDLLSESVLDQLGGAEPPPSRLTWESVAPKALGFRDNMEKGVIDRWLNDDEKRPGAVLVFGPPGTGKTTIAKLLARELEEKRQRFDATSWRFLEITPADFARKGADRIVACAEELFSRLRDVRRCVVLLDEMEEFLRARSPEADKDSRLITTAFLPLLQEVVERRESILVVATNFVGSIDPAVTRRGRFDMILPLGPPHEEDRRRAVQRFIDIEYREKHTDIVNAAAEARYPSIVETTVRYTMGYTTPEIREFVSDLLSRLSGKEQVNASDVINEVWKIRSERVPTALSGLTGCDWQTFADEANRYARGISPNMRDEYICDPTYWSEPELPLAEERWPSKVVPLITT